MQHVDICRRPSENPDTQEDTMSKFLIALVLGLSVIALAPCERAVAVQSGAVALVGQGVDGSGVLTLSGEAGTGYSVRALQEDGTYAIQAQGCIPAAGSVTLSVVVSIPSSPGVPMFNVSTWFEGQPTIFSVTPTFADDGWWLW